MGPPKIIPTIDVLVVSESGTSQKTQFSIGRHRSGVDRVKAFSAQGK